MKTVIDFSVFNIFGVIVGTTDTLNAISAGIRGAEVAVRRHDVAEGLEATVSPRVPSHCLMSYPEHDLYQGIELTYPGINTPLLKEYDEHILLNHIVFVARPPTIADDTFLQHKIKKWFRMCLSRQTKYNVGGLFKWLGIGRDEPGKLYCAQFTREYLRFLIACGCAIDLPPEWEDKISPDDLKTYCLLKNWMIPWKKQVDDNYDPLKPIDAD